MILNKRAKEDRPGEDGTSTETEGGGGRWTHKGTECHVPGKTRPAVEGILGNEADRERGGAGGWDCDLRLPLSEAAGSGPKGHLKTRAS